MNIILKKEAFMALKKVMESYSPISDETWKKLEAICTFKSIKKNCNLYNSGEVPETFSFVCSGLFRAFTIDNNGTEYNKIFFDEGKFPGSMTALLTSTPSQLTIESLEPSSVVLINFKDYRRLLLKTPDLMLFHIFYLERNWLLAKDAREIEIVQEDAFQRYSRFLQEYPLICARIAQYHIASHLGITPTQLSRIRKKI
ncbi:MAG: Crp/Fnr family transcriptional regulator [Gammaproteobacteria bacterium]|nr:Crp/Fnr family transcriptional regulator [Gammaproteobacteria bacterium]